MAGVIPEDHRHFLVRFSYFKASLA
jgi:hypothetical protein